MKKKASAVIALIAVMVIVMIAYVLIHELGHGFAAIASGGRITRLSIALAHTWYEGGSTSPLIMSLNHMAGMLLPVLLSFAGLIFYNRSAKNLIYQFAYGLFFIMTMTSVLSWVFLPVLSFFTQIPPGDDVTKFLESSQLQPLLVTLIGVIIIALLISFAFLKKLPQNLIGSFQTVIHTKSNESILSKKALAGLLAVVVLLISTAALLEVAWLSSKPIISLTVSDPITSADDTRKFGFIVEESGAYELDVKLTASGYVTDILILDHAQNVVYQNIAESISAKDNLTLGTGEYTIYVEHLYDLEAFERYCSSMNYTFNGDAQVLAYLKSAYDNMKQEPSLSLTIK